jgi:hypothetical protein
MNFFRITLTITLSIVLIFAFGLHSIDTKHVHYGATQSVHQHDGGAHTHTDPVTLEIKEYFHGIEQKLFLVILLALICCGAFWLRNDPPTFELLTLLSESLTSRSSPLPLVTDHDYLSALFRTGILHPKLH